MMVRRESVDSDKIMKPTIQKSESEVAARPAPKPRTSSISSSGHPGHSQSLSLSSDIPASTAASANNLLSGAVAFPYFGGTSASGIDAGSFLLINELRTNNTQLKLMLDNLVTKVDNVYNKVDEVKGLSVNVPSFKSSLTMDSTFLIASIQKIVDENSSLKEDLDDKNKRLLSLNGRLVCEMLQSQGSASKDCRKGRFEISRVDG